jgi:integrase
MIEYYLNELKNRPISPWRLRMWLGSSGKVKNKFFKTKALAKNFIANDMEKFINTIDMPKDTLSSIYKKEYLPYRSMLVERGELRQRSLTTEKGHFDNYIFPVLKDIQLATLSKKHVTQLIDYCKTHKHYGKFISTKTIINVIKSLGVFCVWCRKHEYITTHPTEDHGLKQNKIKKKWCPTIEEVNLLIQHTENPRDKFLFFLMAYTGIDTHEAQALQKSDFDITYGTLNINKGWDNENHVMGKTKTEYRDRKISLDNNLVKVYIEHLKNVSLETEFVFPSDNNVNKPVGYSVINDALKKAYTRAKIHWNDGQAGNKLHALRHFAISYYRHKRMDLVKLKELVGHGPLSTLTEDTYTHNVTEERDMLPKSNSLLMFH